jgi:hypothetical protein
MQGTLNNMLSHILAFTMKGLLDYVVELVVAEDKVCAGLLCLLWS